MKLEVMSLIRLADADGRTVAMRDIELLLNGVVENAGLLVELFGTPCTQYLFSVSKIVSSLTISFHHDSRVAQP